MKNVKILAAHEVIEWLDRNVEFPTEGTGGKPFGPIFLVFDPKKRLGRSASGKTTLVATSEGNQTVPGYPEIKFGLNVYTS